MTSHQRAPGIDIERGSAVRLSVDAQPTAVAVFAASDDNALAIGAGEYVVLDRWDEVTDVERLHEDEAVAARQALHAEHADRANALENQIGALGLKVGGLVREAKVLAGGMSPAPASRSPEKDDGLARRSELEKRLSELEDQLGFLRQHALRPLEEERTRAMRARLTTSRTSLAERNRAPVRARMKKAAEQKVEALKHEKAALAKKYEALTESLVAAQKAAEDKRAALASKEKDDSARLATLHEAIATLRDKVAHLIDQKKRMFDDEGLSEKAIRGANAAFKASTLYRALRAYFFNGGGRAYVCGVSNLLAVVPTLPDVTLLVQAGVAGRSGLTDEMVTTLCTAETGIFALLDAPDQSLEGITHTRLLKHAHAAHYYPWLCFPGDADSVSASASVPPSAAVAAVMAKVDRTSGVWKAPANVSLSGVDIPKTSRITEIGHEKITAHNPAINLLRILSPGEAPMIWGARTATGNDDRRWRYISVRRFFSAIERDIRHAMRAMMFEPNTSVTWQRVRLAIETYLHRTWIAGGLYGKAPEQAYAVHVGLGITMNRDDIESGKLIVAIDVAIARPAEFVTLAFTQTMADAAAHEGASTVETAA